jgi:hypothetical protein
MFYIVKKCDTGLLETYNKRRKVFQWFYDSSNEGWKTESGAFRALCKLQKQSPKYFDGCTVFNTEETHSAK